MEIQILDSAGKPLEHLTQWDRNREIRVTGLADMDILPDFHFYNRDAYRALVVPGVNADGGLKAQIPNVLLQSADDLSVSVYQRKANGEGQSLLIRNIPIWKSRKPQDYTFTENVEYIRFEDLVKQSEAVLSDLQAKSADAAAAADQAKKTAQDVETALENGAFNGPEGPAGPAGADGFSPVANVTKTAGGAAIRIADKKGVTEVTIANGKDGAPGKDGANGRDGAPGIQGEPGKDAPQIDDSQPGPGNPFSGQHTADLIAAAKEETYIRTVDALAPVFEKTGAIVQGQLVESYPIDVVSELNIIQEGTGDPSPENVRPFVLWNGAKLTACGKNLIPFPYYSKSGDYSGVRIDVLPDGGIQCVGKNTKSVPIFFNLCIIHFSDEALNPTNGEICISGKDVLYDPRNSITSIRFLPGASWNEIVYPQIESGTVPTSYEPYHGETFTATFSEPVVEGELDWAHDRLAKTRQLLSFNGTENNWQVADCGAGVTGKRFLIRLPNARKAKTANELINTACTHFTAKTANDIYATGESGVAISVNGYAVFKPKADMTTLAEWKDYLKAQSANGKPVTIAYLLDQPITTTVSTTGSPLGKAGVNSLYSATGDVTVRGRENPAVTMKEQSERIAALEAAIMKPRG